MVMQRKQLIILTFSGRVTGDQMDELKQEMRINAGLPEDQVKICIIENCTGATVVEYAEQDHTPPGVV